MILRSLTSIYPDNSKYYRRYQREATKLLKQLLLHQPEATASLLDILSDRWADFQLRRVTAKALGEAGERQSDIVEQLLTILVDPDSRKEYSITALGSLGKGHPEVIEILLNFVPDDPYPSLHLLEAIAQAMGRLGNEEPRAIAKLFDFLPNSSMNTFSPG